MMHRGEVNKLAHNIVEHCDYQRRTKDYQTVSELSDRIEYDAYSIIGRTERTVTGRLVKWGCIAITLTAIYAMGLYGGRVTEREVMQNDCYDIDQRYVLCEKEVILK